MSMRIRSVASCAKYSMLQNRCWRNQVIVIRSSSLPIILRWVLVIHHQHRRTDALGHGIQGTDRLQKWLAFLPEFLRPLFRGLVDSAAAWKCCWNFIKLNAADFLFQSSDILDLDKSGDAPEASRWENPFMAHQYLARPAPLPAGYFNMLTTLSHLPGKCFLKTCQVACLGGKLSADVPSALRTASSCSAW